MALCLDIVILQLLNTDPEVSFLVHKQQLLQLIEAVRNDKDEPVT